VKAIRQAAYAKSHQTFPIFDQSVKAIRQAAYAKSHQTSPIAIFSFRRSGNRRCF